MNTFRRISLVDAIFRSVPGMDRIPKTQQEDQGPWLREYLTEDSTNQDIDSTKHHEATLPHALHVAFSAPGEPGDKDIVPELEADEASVGSTDRLSFDSSYLTELEELREELQRERQLRAQAEAESKQLRNKVKDLTKRNIRLQRQQDMRAQVIEAEEVAAAKERERWTGEILKSCEGEIEEIGKEAKQALDELCGMIANGLKKVDWEEENDTEVEIEEWRMDVALATYEEEEEDEEEKQRQQLEEAKMLYQKEHREPWKPTELANIGIYFDFETYLETDVQPIVSTSNSTTTPVSNSMPSTTSIEADR